LAAWDLINGRLVRPFPDSRPVSKTYWIVCPKATMTLPKIVTFRDWLLSEAARDLRQLRKVGWSTKPSTETGGDRLNRNGRRSRIRSPRNALSG
jgi:LysR family transcriptional regulator, glycine cleavage system transcriptional activator